MSHRNFRLFWSGNVISLVGTLAQDAAVGWLVRELTPDPLILTTVAACNTIPVMLLTVYAGAVADRVDKARGLFVTNALTMVLALVLWLLVVGGHVAIWHVALIALGVGTVRAFDINIRQSMNVEMVGRADLPNAIALNSTAFNGARVIGPAIGGLLISWFGTAGCFLVNALSFLPMLRNLRKMELPPVERQTRRASLADMREGFDWVRAHPILAPVTTLIAVCSFFAFSFGNLFPIFARDVFGSDARGFSLLLTSSGVGAVAAAGILAVNGQMRHKGKTPVGRRSGVLRVRRGVRAVADFAGELSVSDGFGLLPVDLSDDRQHPGANRRARPSGRTGVLVLLAGSHRCRAPRRAMDRRAGQMDRPTRSRRHQRRHRGGMDAMDVSAPSRRLERTLNLWPAF